MGYFRKDPNAIGGDVEAIYTEERMDDNMSYPYYPEEYNDYAERLAEKEKRKNKMEQVPSYTTEENLNMAINFINRFQNERSVLSESQIQHMVDHLEYVKDKYSSELNKVKAFNTLCMFINIMKGELERRHDRDKPFKDFADKLNNLATMPR